MREIPRGESDALVYLFTERYGSVHAVVRGLKRSRKRFPGSIRKLCLYEFHLKEEKRGRHSVSSAKLIESFEEIAGEFQRYLVADYVFEVVSRMYPEGVDSSQVFERLLIFLRTLRGGGNPACLAAWMEAFILADSGYFPSSEKCSVCGKGFDGGRVLVDRERYLISCFNCRKEGKYAVVSHEDVLNFASMWLSSSPPDSFPSEKGFRVQLESVRKTVVARLGYAPKSLIHVARIPF